MTAIALIPARGGSKRVVGKNIRHLAGHPLIAYTICAALDSGVFEKVLVSSDSTEILDIAARYGADCLRRPDDLATDTSPDIEWVGHALDAVGDVGVITAAMEGHEPANAFSIVDNDSGFMYDTFSILRPTSPFRKPETIQRAFEDWKAVGEAYTSLRAVERVSQHPAKMWVRETGFASVNMSMRPLLLQPPEWPLHDRQYASLPEVWVQNASLEIAHVRTVLETGTISGERVAAFVTEGDEGLDVNTQRDWDLAEYLLDRGDATLPAVKERGNA